MALQQNSPISPTYRPFNRRIWLVTALMAILASNAGSAQTPQKDPPFLVRTVDPKSEQVQLFWKDDSGQPLRSFTALQQYVAQDHLSLLFAANAGMYEDDRSPVGLLVLAGKTVHRLNTRNASGNFYLKPNGVFYIDKHRAAHVIDSTDYPKIAEIVMWATQSGPLLLKNGVIHPAFIAGSKNRLIRSGVGINSEGNIVLVLSLEPINFYDFATYFQSLHCRNALFLDGTVSAFYSPSQPEFPLHDFGPLLAIVKPER